MSAMEITRALHSSCSKLPFHTPLAYSFSSRVITRTSLPIISRHTHLQKPLAVSCSAADDRSSGSATKVAVADDSPSVALKNKAMDISPGLKGTSIFLVGMRSSKKSSLGKLLANVLRYYYFDSDSLIEEAAGGASAAKSLMETDKKSYQESETEVLKQLSSMGRLVVCAGDGAVRSSTNLALLRYGISIWIDVPVEMVSGGVMEDESHLPAFDVSASASYPEDIRGGYATADATVSVEKLASELSYDEIDAVTTEDMALEVLKEIEKLTRVQKMMEEAARPF